MINKYGPEAIGFRAVPFVPSGKKWGKRTGITA